MIGSLTLAWFISLYPDENVHLFFCDVGQGDAILISHGFTQVLVDGGRNTEVMTCLQEHVPLWDRSLEVVVSTQPDEDHLGGLTTVLQRYQVQTLLMSPRGKDTQAYQDFLQVVKKKKTEGLRVLFPTFLQKLRPDTFLSFMIMSPIIQTKTDTSSLLEGAETVLWAEEKNQESIKNSINNESIVLFLLVKKVKIMLTGDIEAAAELALVRSGVLQDVDILKVAHHGSKTSSTRQFLDHITPEVAIISCGKKNKYGHPHAQTLQQLTAISSQIFRTDEEGTIEIVTNGETYWKREK